MNKRTLKEIEDEMDVHANEGNIGKVLDLVDEHGYIYDAMYRALADGDVKRIKEIQALGVDLNGEHSENFLHHAVKNDQLLSVVHLVNGGADVDKLIEIATADHKHHILQWANLWKQGKDQVKRP